MSLSANTRVALIFCAFISLLLWLFLPYPWMWFVRYVDSVPPVSYDGRIQFNLDNLKKPKNETEIVNIVKDAYQSRRKIRVLADGHSWSQIAQTQDIMISLVDYAGIVEYDRKALTVTVRAGTPLHQISTDLDKMGLAMMNLGSVAGQSVAGAISTGTHGTGLTVGNLAENVLSLRIVTGNDGQVLTLSANDNNTDLFKAAQVSIGMFGVISEVTLKVQKKFKLKEIRTHHKLNYCLDHMDSLVKGDHKYVKMWVEFNNNFCVLYQTSETDEEITRIPTLEGFLIYYSFAIQTRITYLLPFLTPLMMHFVNIIGFGCDTVRVDKSYNIFNDFFHLPVHQEGEVVVPYSHAAEAVRAIESEVLIHQHPVNYMTEVRFVKGDDIWLSPEYGTVPGTCAITLTMYAPESTALQYFNAVYDVMKGFNARFHWGKHFKHGAREIEQLYPKYWEFKTLRAKMDPKNIFVNKFLDEKFEI